MEMLRDKIKGLERRIIEMIRHGQENEAIADRLHRWVHTVLLTHNDLALPTVLLEALKDAFLIPQAAVRVWGTDERPLRDGLADLHCTEDVSADVRSFATSLTQPYCGMNSGFEAARWLGLPPAEQMAVQAKQGRAIFGVDLNLYAFVGVIMLVGLVKKNGIMMIDFALKAEREQAMPAREAIRQAVNAWIRTGGAYDGVIDFDAVMRDPANPKKMKADLQSGDWLHPNDAGYKVMGEAVDLALFR